MRHQVLCACLSIAIFANPALAAASQEPRETGANSVEIPAQILKSGVSLNTSLISPNSLQLADTIGLTEVLERIRKARLRVESIDPQLTLESIAAKQELLGAVQKAELIITRTSLDIDFTVAEIQAEGEVYQEMLAKFVSDRDKLVARVNAASFVSNGVLWAINGAFTIPGINTTFADNPRNVVQWPIPAGIVGILAGLIPSFASMYTLKAVNGKKKTSETDPNMLAKLFGYDVTSENEYPQSVWTYLHQVPADQPNGKKRIDQMVDRWISDSNIPNFTDRESRKQLDVLTASVSQKKGLSIATLSTRLVMLNQLEAEVWKMKRMLLELTMAVQGEKALS